MIRFRSLIWIAALAISVAACGGETNDQTSTQTGSSAAAGAYLLKADLSEAKNVFSAKKKVAGDEVAVFGRVRAEFDGSASFTIIDEVIEYCGQGAEKCGCPTPWDYCCEDPDTIPEASLPVEVRDAKGEVVDVASGDIRLLDLIALKGTLEKTESGGLILVTRDGWFRRDRPDMPEGIHWPE